MGDFPVIHFITRVEPDQKKKQKTKMSGVLKEKQRYKVIFQQEISKQGNTK